MQNELILYSLDIHVYHIDKCELLRHSVKSEKKVFGYFHSQRARLLQRLEKLNCIVFASKDGHFKQSKNIKLYKKKELKRNFLTFFQKNLYCSRNGSLKKRNEGWVSLSWFLRGARLNPEAWMEHRLLWAFRVKNLFGVIFLTEYMLLNKNKTTKL